MSRLVAMKKHFRRALFLAALGGCLGFPSASGFAQDRVSPGRSVVRTPKTSPITTEAPEQDGAAEGESDVPVPPRVPKAPARDIDAPPNPQSLPSRTHSNDSFPDLAEPSELMEEPWAEPLEPQRGWWASAEYVLWWRRGIGLPALVTTSPDGTSATDAGVLGANSTVLYGNQTVADQARPGARLSFGWWADPDQTRGMMTRAYWLSQARGQFSANQSDYPILARPFLDVTGAPDQNSLLVAFTGGEGNILVQSQSDFVGGDALWRQMVYVSPRSRVDLLLGYQFANFNDSLTIDSVSDPNTAPFQVTDSFSTRNEYHAGVLGMQLVYDRPGVRLDLLAKVGFGNMHQSVQIDGTSNGVSGGLLAQATNIGTYSRNVFSVAPELGATVTWFLSDSIEFSLGYSLLYYTHVTQSNMAIDPNLAVNLSVPFAGAARPQFVFKDDDYWIHGVNFGVTFRY